MKITSKTLMVEFEHDVTVGHNNVIEATIEHQAFIFDNTDGSIGFELDFSEVKNVKFMGLPVEGGYTAFNKFKEKMLEIGIDVEKLFDDKAAQLITDEDMDTLKSMYKLNKW